MRLVDIEMFIQRAQDLGIDENEEVVYSGHTGDFVVKGVDEDCTSHRLTMCIYTGDINET